MNAEINPLKCYESKKKNEEKKSDSYSLAAFIQGKGPIYS